MGLPNKLYKFESFSELSLRNLKRQAIYFGSPRGFNDPYDCAITAQIKNLTPEQVEQYKNHLLADDKTTIEERNNLIKHTAPEIGELVSKLVSEDVSEIKEKVLSTFGISCFSEINNDLLMWSHYGGRYKGFCLEFDSNQPFFNKAKKVTYSDSMPKIDPMKVLSEGIYYFEELFCVKSKSWEYEKEWRIFHKQAGTLFTYPTEALTGVFFGPDIEPECLEIIALILRGQNEKVKLFQGQRSQDAFKVEFVEVNYTPYLVAKKMGLR